MSQALDGAIQNCMRSMIQKLKASGALSRVAHLSQSEAGGSRDRRIVAVTGCVVVVAAVQRQGVYGNPGLLAPVERRGWRPRPAAGHSAAGS